MKFSASVPQPFSHLISGLSKVARWPYLAKPRFLFLLTAMVFGCLSLATDIRVRDKKLGYIGELERASAIHSFGLTPLGDYGERFDGFVQECGVGNPATLEQLRCLCDTINHIMSPTRFAENLRQGLKSRMDGTPVFLEGQVLAWLVELDNTSEAGGGPFSAEQAMVKLSLPQGASLLFPQGQFENGAWRIEAGAIESGMKVPLLIVIQLNQSGTHEIQATVSTELFDPEPANNNMSEEFVVLEPKKHLIFPWVSNNDRFKSQMIVNNFGDRPALINLRGIRGEGMGRQFFEIVPAWGFLKLEAGDVFSELGNGSGMSVLLASNSETISGVWVTNDLSAASGKSPSIGVAISLDELQQPNQKRAGNRVIFNYLPTAPGTLSAPVLVNLASQDASVNLDFYNQQGMLVQSETTILAGLEPFRPFAKLTTDLLDDDSEDVYLMAHSDDPITGVSFVFNQFGEPSMGNVVSVESEAGNGARWLLPWISNNSGFESIISINNPSDEPAEITLTAQRFEGTAETASALIPARGFLRAMASDLFPQLGEGAGYGVQIQSPQPAIAANWVTNNLVTPSGSSPSQGVGVNLNNQTTGSANGQMGQHLIYGFLPITDGMISGPVIVNVGDQNTAVTLYYFDGDGTLVFRDNTTLTTLEPFRPFAAVTNDLLPPGSGDVQLIASSDGQPLTGVNFAFNLHAEPAIGNVNAISFTPPN